MISYRHTLISLLGAVTFAATSAHAAVDYGAADTNGRVWIRATTLAEGEALGFRAASNLDFSAYLTGGGFGADRGTQEFFSRTVNRSLMGFRADTTISTDMTTQYASPSVALGWLEGSTDAVGAMLYTTGRQMGACPGGYSYNCYFTIYVNEAAYGTLAELQARQRDFYYYNPNGDWKTALAQVPQVGGRPSLGYFMVKAVPEASTWAMMGLGLLAVGLAAGRRRST